MRSTWFSTKKSGFKTVRSAATSLLIVLMVLASSNKLFAGSTSATATLHITVNVVNTVNSQPEVPAQQYPLKAEGIIYNLAPHISYNGPAELPVQAPAMSHQKASSPENCNPGESPAILQALIFVSK